MAFDGILAQLDDEMDSTPYDLVLITLLREESCNCPSRYQVWLQRALVNAAIAQLDDGETGDSLTLLEEALTLGPVPQELDRDDRTALNDAIRASTLSERTYARLERVQAWLLSS